MRQTIGPDVLYTLIRVEIPTRAFRKVIKTDNTGRNVSHKNNNLDIV